jgi:prevent-host-death family protein
MKLNGREYEVGVRELQDRLGAYLDLVEQGGEVIVTRRGRPIARLSAIDGEGPLQDLIRRGLVTPPVRARSLRRPIAKARGSVSDLVAEQRR